MSQITYRGNLASATWPLISALFGRSVIVGGPDQNFIRQLYSPEDPDKDIGVPQIYYLHNVLPTSSGFGSIGFEIQSAGISGLTNVDNVNLIQGSDGAKAYLCKSDAGVGVYQLPAKVFTLLLPLVPPYTTSQITTATINGVTYFYVANLGCFTYDPTSGVVTPITLIGLTAAQIIGITSSNGYLIAYSINQVLWSSLVNPLDFVPSLATGAGGGAVENVKGNIAAVVSIPEGIIVASNSNAVAGVFTANPRFPFQFTEIKASGGLLSTEYIAYDTNSGNIYAYTSNGLQLLSSQGAQFVFPDVTDFLAGQIFEDFDEGSLTFSVLELASALKKKLVLISSRYLVISYGITQLTHALIYDLGERRWGKVKLTHTDCFEYQLLDQAVSDIPKKSIAFVTSLGEVKTINVDQEAVNRVGVALFGKFQYVRDRFLQINNAQLESIKPTFACDLYLYSSLNGKDLGTPVKQVNAIQGERIKLWNMRSNALNFSLLFKGAFSLSSIILNFTVSSRR